MPISAHSYFYYKTQILSSTDNKASNLFSYTAKSFMSRLIVFSKMIFILPKL